MERVAAHQVEVLKYPGTTDGQDSVAVILGMSPEDTERGLNSSVWEGVKGIAFIRDPDGYVIEIAQQS